MRKLILLIAFAITTSYSYGQEKVMVGDKIYRSTPEFDLYQISNGSLSLTSIKVSIGIQGQQGALFLSTTTFNSSTRIGGQLLIYLSDDTVVKCVDRNIRDHVNGIGTSVYYLTAEELSKIKSVNIDAIRYSIVSEYSKSDYLVSNTNFKESGIFGREIKKIDFPSHIRKLQ